MCIWSKKIINNNCIIIISISVLVSAITKLLSATSREANQRFFGPKNTNHNGIERKHSGKRGKEREKTQVVGCKVAYSRKMANSKTSMLIRAGGTTKLPCAGIKGINLRPGMEENVEEIMEEITEEIKT